jgi:hypothetical protein
MRVRAVLIAAGAVVALAGPALAEGPKVYPYHAKHNFCPTGLQPIQISGVICCGTPNQTVSYSSMLHQGGTKKKRRAVKASSADCPIGQKGCNFN